MRVRPTVPVPVMLASVASYRDYVPLLPPHIEYRIIVPLSLDDEQPQQSRAFKSGRCESEGYAQNFFEFKPLILHTPKVYLAHTH